MTNTTVRMRDLVRMARRQNPGMSEQEARELAAKVAESLRTKGWRRG